jgi:TonB family protein
MLPFRSSRGRAALLAALWAATIPAFPSAAHADEAEAPAPPVLVPPKLKTYAEPVYPKEKLDKGVKASVVVELTIDATGKVTAAKVTTSGGDDFDAAALEAAPRLVFEPATKGGKPIPAKIPFKFDFDFKEVPVTPPKDTATTKPKAPVIVLRGLVRTAGEDPIAGASVTTVSPSGAISSTITDEKGSFAFADLPPGKYKVRVESAGFVPFEAEEEISKGLVTQVTYRPNVVSDSIDLVVKGDKPPREVTKHVIDVKEIARIPGTNGDALRAVQNMPGVARAPGLAGLLIIRGSAPQDTNVFIDGTLVPLVYHFGGLSSVVPTELLDRLDFYPGNFGPEFGRVMGGIVDVGIRSPKKDGYHGLLQFDLIDGRILAEGPIDDKTRFAVAGRRSWVDVWLKPVLVKAGTGVSTAPVYYDYQVMLERDITESTTARLLFFGSDDRLALTLTSPSATDPAAGGNVGIHTGFMRLQARVETRASKDVRWTNTLAYGTDTVDFGIGDFFFNLLAPTLSWRSDVRAKISKEAAFIVGLDYLGGNYHVTVNFPPRPPLGEAPGPFFARPAVFQEGKGTLYRPGAYAMLDLSPIPALKLLPGVRVDYQSDAGQWTVSPRFATRYDLVPTAPRTTLKGGIGVFQQPPLPNESILPFGTPGVSGNRATHYSIGFEQDFTRYLGLSLEGFYKDLQNLVIPKAAASTSATGVSYVNEGSGRVFGAELLFKYKQDEHFFGWIAYTLSRSERRDGPGQPLHGYQFDQTHIFTILGSYKLGRGWEAGLRWRYVSGNLYTPNVGGVMDFDAGAHAPVQSFSFYSARLPAFHQLDMRIDKLWKFASWRLSAYLDVQNVYNRQNPEGLQYNYNYSQSTTVSGLPILPIIGIRGEL